MGVFKEIYDIIGLNEIRLEKNSKKKMFFKNFEWINISATKKHGIGKAI